MIPLKTSQLSTQLQNGEPVRLSFSYNNKTTVKFLNSLFTKFLGQHDMIYLQSTVETVLREMVVNAVKANSKRVYFEKEGLDILNENHYSRGMEEFKNYIVTVKENISVDLKKSGYKVEVILKKDKLGLNVVVRNNVALLPFEQERINMRIAKAKEYNDFSDIYMDISDDQEGEGLGIPLTILFLKNSGIGENSFSIKTNGKITQSSFKIPYVLKSFELTNVIQQHVLEKVDELPTFPENVLELQEMCKDPHVEIQDLVDKISFDLSLTAAVLKLSNSASFIISKNVDSLSEAIKIIGLKNLNTILVSSGSRKIMDEHFTSFKEVWKHCNKTAFYAKKLAQKFKMNKSLEKAVLASLLHDLGKIVLLSVNSELANVMDTVAVKREVRISTVIEEISIGISHSTIGKIIAEKWKLPEYIVETLAYHHSPLCAKEEFREVVYITYLANKLCLIEDKKFDFYYLEDEVLNYFGINGEKEFTAIHDQLSENFIEMEKLEA